jgi:hypothetical protein
MMNGNDPADSAGDVATFIAEPGPILQKLDLAETGTISTSSDLSLRSYLTIREKLQYEGMYFPMGFPVRVLSDSKAVLDAANESWYPFKAVFHRRPLEISITVKPEAAGIRMLPPAPSYTRSGSLMVLVADTNNFIIADLKHGRAIGKVTEATVRNQAYFRYHLLEGAALCMVAALRAVPIHGACVRVGTKGILLCGDSGDGKSTLAFAGARAGWTYISDDATYIPIDRTDRMVLGNCHRIRFRPSATALFPELGGRPITPRATGKPSIEVCTSEWPHLAVANAAYIDHIVFLNRKCHEEHELVSVRASAVWPWFQQHVFSSPETAPAQEAALSRLLTANIFELRYRDLAWAIERIQHLATKESE